MTELARDFIDRGVDVISHVAAIGVHCWPYAGEDGQEPRGTVDGLEVVMVGRGRVVHALYHPDSALYGFINQLDGAARIHVRDPSGRFLARAAVGSVLGAMSLRERLIEGKVPPHPDEYRASIIQVRMRVAPTSANLALQTTVEGRILRADATPHVYARVALFATEADARSDQPALYVTHTDLEGRFVVWPRYLLEMPNMRRYLKVWLMKEPPRAADRDPLLGFPADFDELRPGAPSFDEVWRDGGGRNVDLRHGQRNQALIQQPMILE